MRTIGETLEHAVSFALDDFNGDHWCGTMSSNATVTAQWIFLHQCIKREIPPAHQKAYLQHFISTQQSSGGWALAPQAAGDVSTSIEAYCAIKILGLSCDDPVLVRARNFILSVGGMEKMRILTRVYLAMFGLVAWDTVPQMPPEIIFLPSWFPLNIYRFASWARSAIVPLSLLRTREPLYTLEVAQWPADKDQSTFLDELWLDPTRKRLPRPGMGTSIWRGIHWMTLCFHLVELLLRLAVFLGITPLRQKATRSCVGWLKVHQEPQGDSAGIYPPMHLTTMALLLEESHLDTRSPIIALTLAAMDRFCAETDELGRWMQPSVSPTWDTFLMIRALLDSGLVPKDHSTLKRAASWTHEQQITKQDVGDWRVFRPHGVPGGFAFEYFNAWYPDVDDTAAAVLALLHHDHTLLTSGTVTRAASWILAMQCKNGGWAAFDADNDALFLNRLPFADMQNMCDPATPDVTGRCLEAFGLMLQINARSSKQNLDSALEFQIRKSCERGLRFLEDCVEDCGAWLGRWGVNYIFGTATVLCGLESVGVKKSSRMIDSALSWLESVQNSDGGWGESLGSYADISLAGRGSFSTPTQTAWALLGLLAYRRPTSPSIVRGVDWLMSRMESGTWREDVYTATGFPGHFYLGYSLYSHYFPLMALGRFRRSLTTMAGSPGM